MEVENGSCSSTVDEPTVKQIETPHRHSAVVKLDLDTEDVARKVLSVLSVDEEPSRSTTVRSFAVEGSNLHIMIEASDRKSLQKSLANLLDMCSLAKSTIDLALQKKWISISEPAQKKLKNCSH
nr:1110049G11Rik protein [Haemonchus contortus]